MNIQARQRYTFLLLILVLFACGSVGEEQKNWESESGVAEKETVDNKTSENESPFKVTFIELGSVKCIPCKMMQPIMEEIEKEYGDQVNVVFHDVWTDQGRPFAEIYRIRVIPTQVFLDKDGKEYFRHEGFFPKEELVKVLKRQGVE